MNWKLTIVVSKYMSKTRKDTSYYTHFLKEFDLNKII